MNSTTRGEHISTYVSSLHAIITCMYASCVPLFYAIMCKHATLSIVRQFICIYGSLSTSLMRAKYPYCGRGLNMRTVESLELCSLCFLLLIFNRHYHSINNNNTTSFYKCFKREGRRLWGHTNLLLIIKNLCTFYKPLSYKLVVINIVMSHSLLWRHIVLLTVGVFQATTECYIPLESAWREDLKKV